MYIFLSIYLYVFGFLGILLTQAAENGWNFRPLLTDYPSMFGMLAWPITVPLAIVLTGYEAFMLWMHKRRGKL